MTDYEEMILAEQESEEDDCKACPYKGTKCRNQCMEVEYHHNPVLVAYGK